jgi:ankyrin repeat protein
MKSLRQYSLIISLTIITIATSQTAQSNVDLYDENGKTAFIKAISTKDLNEVKSLLNKGANINHPEQNGLEGTPLMYAVSTGDLKLCKLLIENGANVNQLDSNRDHALNWATYYGYIPIMNMLIKKGADVKLKSKHGTAVDVAFRLWHNDSVAQPFMNTEIARPISTDEKRLVNAVINSDEKNVKKLLKKGISANTKDELDSPILHLAIHRGDAQMVNLLIDNKVDVNAMNRVGQSALAWSARFGYLNILNNLLNSGADVNRADEDYRLTPLMGASLNGKESVVALLIENGALIEIKDVVNQATALHWALWFRQGSVAKLLLQRGADFMYKALDGTYSAYEIAELNKMDDVLLIMNALKEESNTLEGSWKIQEIHYVYPDTTYIRKDLDYGRLLLGKHNYTIMYNPIMMKRTPFKNLSKAEDSEIKNAFQTIVFNSGTYVLEDDVIHTTADIAKVPGFEGGQQYYKMNLENDMLTMTMYDETYPNGNKPDWFGKLKVKFLLKKE